MDPMERIAVVIAVVAALVVAAFAVILAATAEPSTAGSFGREPTCAEWTDGCVVCRRTAQGTVCSTPGIACTRADLRCLRRDGT
jgi:hypothetical protein